MCSHGGEGQSEDALHGHLALGIAGGAPPLCSRSSLRAASSKTLPSSDSIIPDSRTCRRKPPTDRRGIRRSPPKVWLKTEKGPMWKSSTAWTEGPKGRRANGAPALASGPVMRPVPNSICRVPPVHTSHQLPTCGSLRSPAWARSIRPGQPEKCHVVTGDRGHVHSKHFGTRRKRNQRVSEAQATDHSGSDRHWRRALWCLSRLCRLGLRLKAPPYWARGTGLTTPKYWYCLPGLRWRLLPKAVAACRENFTRSLPLQVVRLPGSPP